MINYQLIKKFNLNVLDLQQILKDIGGDINREKLIKNLEYLSNTEIGKTKNLNLENFSSFLYNISEKISEELQEYAN